MDTEGDRMQKKTIWKKVLPLLAVLTLALVLLTGCGSGSGGSSGSSGSSDAPEISGLKYEETVKLDYAKCFDIYKYEGGYALIKIKDEGQFLVVPKGKDAPDGLSKKITVIKQPADHIYNAATASMALFSSMGALDNVTMCSLKEDGWSFSAPKKALRSGKMVYAGKYDQPDYELLLDKKCDLAIESTMIYHAPEVKEMIEKMDIPVLVDRSSYETNPLGRTEWIKLYGVITGHEKEAEDFFDKQVKKVDSLSDIKNTGKTVAFFYVSSDGKFIVRRSKDYIPTMIKIAGGKYIFKNLTDDEGKTTIAMSAEKFYDTAESADILIYDGSIDSSVTTKSALLAKDPIIKEFKAVKKDHCWVSKGAMYQRTDAVGDMILDFHKVIAQGDKAASNLTYIEKLE